MSEEEQVAVVIEKLLDIANSYVDSYCDTYDEYVLDDNEIEEIEDEEDRERARELKETDDFLKKAATFLEEYKENNLQPEEVEEEELWEE